MGGELVPVKGIVQARGAIGNLMVEIDSIGGGLNGFRTEVGHQGSFRFMGVKPGHYTLKVVDLYGNVIQREFIDVHRSSGPVIIRLEQPEKEPSKGGVISVQRLQHKVPKAARKEHERADKAMKENDVEKSIAHLKKAVEIDPQFVEAYINLGARHLKLNQPEKALAAFESAVKIDENLSVGYSNAAAALIVLQRFEEAETAAQKALDSDPTNLRGRYMLGLALLHQNKDVDKAVNNLQRACAEFPAARIAVAQAFASLGQREQAKHELRSYLDSGRPEDREQVETWLARLNGTQ
jgi:tetratricopeptide (TPR) repeat protein